MSQDEVGQPSQWDTAFREGYAHGLGKSQGIPYRQAWMLSATQAQNAAGEWVPALPLPLFIFPHRHRCSCGRWFWTMGGYRGHYAVHHILDGHGMGERAS